MTNASPHKLSDINTVARTATCELCGKTKILKFGHTRKGEQRWACETVNKNRNGVRRENGPRRHNARMLRTRRERRLALQAIHNILESITVKQLVDIGKIPPAEVASIVPHFRDYTYEIKARARRLSEAEK